MASSARLMTSSSTANSDLARQTPPIYSVDPSPSAPKNRGSSVMEDLIPSIYDPSDNGGGKISDEVWKEISVRKTDGGDGSAFNSGMTLEEYLGKEEVRVSAGFALDPAVVGLHQGQLAVEGQAQSLGFGNGAEGGGRGRGRKRPVLDPVDRAALQRQKRMIKNRESAARSRERKQAYTVELESMVTKLEGRNAELLQKQEVLRKERYQQLIKNIIPVDEKEKPRRPPFHLKLKRTVSMEW